MREYLDLDCTPCDETCTPAGDNPRMERIECRAYIGQLKRLFPQWEEKGVTFSVKNNPHDCGGYLSVRVNFDDNDEDAVEYAYGIESGLPEKWDDEARALMEDMKNAE